MQQSHRSLLSDRPVRDSVRSIAEQLVERIEAREYKSRLPAERHLADEFGVSRNAIRDALNLLEESEIIVRQAGSGSFVQNAARQPAGHAPYSLASQIIAERTGPLELHVVRGIFEP